MQNKAFTLVELLVVIAVIAILAALIFPVFASARKKAQQATCVSNLKQIHDAYALYKTDYDGNYPANFSFSGDIPHGWWTPCESYFKVKREALACPNTVYTDRNYTAVHIPGYAMNGRLLTTLRPVNETKVRFPSNTIEFCDAPFEYDLILAPNPWENYINAPDPLPEEPWKRHFNKANYGFCDGHVKAYSSDQIHQDAPHSQDGTNPEFALDWEG